MNTDIQIVILAGGKGKRMAVPIPKALIHVGGKPMAQYVLDTAQKSSDNKPITVIGYKGQMIRESLGDASLYAVQEEQNGTGHAVMMAREHLVDSDADTVIVLYADQPYVSNETLEKLSQVKREKEAKIVIATAIIQDEDLFENQFFNFGRIVRDSDGVITKIVEKKDATPNEIEIREVNPAYFCLDKEWMLEKLENIDNKNAQREYYLTDLVQMAFDEGLTIESVQINEREALGANTPEQLAVLESYLNE